MIIIWPDDVGEREHKSAYVRMLFGLYPLYMYVSVSVCVITLVSDVIISQCLIARERPEMCVFVNVCVCVCELE